jgi:hypothetical protein
MGLAYNVYLNSTKIFGCKHCKTHLANNDDIISRVGILTPTLILSNLANVLDLDRTSAASMAKPTSSTPSSTSHKEKLWNAI